MNEHPRQNPGRADAPFPDLAIVQPDYSDDDTTPHAIPTVLITGAAGTIGRKLRQAWTDRYDLILIDQSPDSDDVQEFDLAHWDEEWAELFDEADAVVHLAANSRADAPWHDLIEPNLDALQNVMLAAATSHVERFVFASSLHVMDGHRPQDGPITTELPPCPGSPFAATKLFGERAVAVAAHVYGFSAAILRLGDVSSEETCTEPSVAENSRSTRLKDADLVEHFTRAIEAEIDPGTIVVVNAVSPNPGNRWSLESAERLLGFRGARNRAP